MEGESYSGQLLRASIAFSFVVCDLVKKVPLHTPFQEKNVVYAVDGLSERYFEKVVLPAFPSIEKLHLFGLAIHQNDHQARRRFVEWAQNEIAVVPDFHKQILFSDEAHFWLHGYVNKQNCRIWSEANPQVYVETPLHPEKLTVWCALWAGGILLQKR
ncbi:uncharacterized protein TNCV_2113661 [Trichonephila clavipes]|nr:uncharacterized protein TNCV_2113661 [Trichonephila clavipes]